MVGRLVGLLVGRLVGSYVGEQVGMYADRYVGKLVKTIHTWMTDTSTDRWINMSVDEGQ